MTFILDVVVPSVTFTLESAQGTPSTRLARLGKDLSALWGP